MAVDSLEIISESEELLRCFQSLLNRSRRVQIITAWATRGPALDCILSSKGPGIEAIVGISGWVTEPKALQTLEERCYLYIAERPQRATFHPKLYLFDLGSERAILIGSPNLTHAAFTANKEVAIVLRPSDDDWERCQALFNELRLEATPFAQFDISAYSKQYDAAPNKDFSKRERTGKKDTTKPPPPVDGPALGPLLESNWHVYLTYLRAHLKQQPYGERVLDDPERSYLYTLRMTRPIIRKRFSALSGEERRMLLGAGDCGWFGKLSVARKPFRELVECTNEEAVAAIDWLYQSMPEQPEHLEVDGALRVGEVFFHRLTSLDGFKEAFATRLLALSRPDVFCSINNKSRHRLQMLFPAISDIRTWDGYRQCLQRLHRSPWWNSRRPAKEIEGELWDARVALIDAYVYDPAKGDDADVE